MDEITVIALIVRKYPYDKEILDYCKEKEVFNAGAGEFFTKQKEAIHASFSLLLILICILQQSLVGLPLNHRRTNLNLGTG